LDRTEHYTAIHPSVKWLNENVIPTLIAPTHNTPKEVRNSFWNFYSQWKNKCIIVTDCGVPVESNFFRMCVADDPATRTWEAPYPLHELGTLLLANNKDPIGVYTRHPDESPAHNPLNDARQSGRLWLEIFNNGRH
jgi:hypothetical protein